MSNSVVPAAAVAHAKQLVRNKKFGKRAEDQRPAQDEQTAADKHDDAANVVQTERADHRPTSMSDTTMSGDFSFTTALSAAADSGASLASTTVAADDGGSVGDDGDGAGGTILLVGAVGLAGLGVAVLAGGGGKSNEAPAFAAETKDVTTKEDTAVTVAVPATDPDGDVLAYSVSTAPTKGTVTIDASGNAKYTPNANYAGADSFVVTVADNEGGTDTIKVNVTVTENENDGPVANAATTKTLTTAEDKAATFVIDFTDPEGNTPITATLATGPAHGTIDLKTNTYTPTKDYNGADSFSYTVTDSKGAATTQTVAVTVTAVNDAPTTAATQAIATESGVAFNGTVVGNDVDAGDVLTYAVKTAAGHGTATIGGADGKFVYTPTAGYTGTDTFTVTVTDKANESATQTINVTVGPTVTVTSIDVVGASPTTPAVIEAGDAKYKFTDTATKDTDVIIKHFTNNDVIAVTGASATEYNFSTGVDSKDLSISFNKGGVANLILIDDVLNASVFVTDYASAAQAIGFNFMTFA